MPFTFQRWFIALLLCATAAAQTLGVVHGIAHGASAGHLHADEPGHAQAFDLHALLVPGEDEAHCAALDQLSHPTPASAAAACTGVAPPLLAPAAFVALAGTLAWRAFDARAPPPIR